jgi:hypothetical protein
MFVEGGQRPRITGRKLRQQVLKIRWAGGVNWHRLASLPGEETHVRIQDLFAAGELELGKNRNQPRRDASQVVFILYFSASEN